MKKQQHTPGPWAYIVPDGHAVRHPQIYSDFGPVANATWLGENKLDQLKANARLISAAPDLLKALIMCCQSMSSVLPDFNPFDQAAYDKARAAIAKATGAGQGGGEQ